MVAGLHGCGRETAPVETTAPTPVATLAGATGAVPPSQLGLCASCHGRDGIAVMANTPSLAGRDREELLAAMRAYLDGTRDFAPMRAMLGPIRPADRERLADWFAAQAPAPVGAPSP